jgi:glycosyltransferase involved in cell wall biosynthesis
MRTENDKIIVVHVVTRMNTGGVAVLISELVQQMDSNTYEVKLITGVCQVGEEDYIKDRGLILNVISIPSLQRSLRPLKDLKAFFSVARELSKIKPNIVHTHTSKAGLIGRIAAKLVCPNAKIVHTFHGHLLQGYFSRLATFGLVKTERLLANLTDQFISMGNEVKSQLIQVGIGRDSQYEVVFPGVDKKVPNYKNSDVLALRGKLPAAIICTFVGRLSPIKRCDRIVELASLKQVQEVGLHFLIIGDGELRSKLEESSSGLPITFLGWQSNSEDWLGISDIALLLSDNEAVPLAMIEAGLAGLPVIATNIGSMSDVVFDGVNGFLVTTEMNFIAGKVLELAKDQDMRRQMGERGRKLAVANFSTETMVTKHERIYSQLTQGRN